MDHFLRLLVAVARGLPAIRVLATALLLPALAHADPNEYLYVPAVEYGEREIDFKFGTDKLKDNAGRESAASLGLGWGATPWWFTEAYVMVHKEVGDTTRYDAFEWENKFQLTQTGRYPVDVGLITEIEVPKEHATEGYELRAGPLFQWDTGLVQWNANALFTRVVRAEYNPDEPHVTEFGYQFQVKYRASPAIEYGVQAFGDLGKWDHWAPSAEQSHRAGPAVSGRLRVGDRETIRYNAAWLAGLNKGAPQNRLRLQAEYEF